MEQYFLVVGLIDIRLELLKIQIDRKFAVQYRCISYLEEKDRVTLFYLNWSSGDEGVKVHELCKPVIQYESRLRPSRYDQIQLCSLLLIFDSE